ncbi:hypothetical protein DM2_2190 [Halorubrum sp. DM2]|uniref:hypothetical protein n=1 Tax=Halorubrum sp. DM2 TaxID=2527867 RepID=UPI0024B69838|nr:hypothetical protein [Halorubrum sp. DM2]VTT86152.1 hypothetical protein DM2_2190 [Halorubrum sp. DM2]
MDELTSSRRRLLAGAVAGGIGVVAGCLGTDSDDPSDDGGAELGLSLSRVDGSLRDRYVRDSDDPAEEWDEAALNAALAGEEYTTQYRKPFFAGVDDPAYVRRDGTHYRLGSVVVDEVAETYPVLRLFEVDGDSDPNSTDGGGESAVDADEGEKLPDADQRAVQIAHFAARARGNVGGYPVGLVQRGGYAYRDGTARTESALLRDDGPERVVYRDNTYRVEVERERFHEAVYRPTAEPVAERPERMEAILRARLVGPRIGSDELSAEADRILRRAATDEYAETYPYSDAYVELLRALDARPYIDGNVRKDGGGVETGEEMIRHDEEYYERYLRILDEGDD